MENQLFKPKMLCRKRINNLLSQIVEVPVFFISASMGYGKTIAVKDFLEKKKDVKTIWFHLGYEENDDIIIWKKFCAAIICINYRLSKKLIKYGFPKDNVGVYEIIDIIRREINKNTVLVIDDWYDRATIYINSLIKAIVLGEIYNLHIVILSRNQPLENYLELEIKNKCIVLWQDDIEFTFNETVELFEINNLNLTLEEQKAIYEYTAGWGFATYRAVIEYYTKNTLNNISEAAEVMKTEVYDKFDDETKQTLLKLSQLNKFTLEQAIYISGNKKSNDVIRELLSNNCFIKYDIQLNVYTLHSILRNVLAEELVSNNIDLNCINNTCGDWYSKNFEDIEAIEYYYKAKNFMRILDLMERNYMIELDDLDPQIINSVFSEISIEEKINRPIVYLAYIFFYILHGNPMSAAKLLYEAKAIYERNENLSDRNQILGEVAVVESFLMFNDFGKMNEYDKKAYELFNGGISKIVNYKMPFTFGSSSISYLYHTKKGGFKNLVDDFEKGIDYFVHISNGCGLGSNYLIRAEYLFETGDLDNGELFAYKALYKAKSKKQASVIISALFILIRIYVNKDDKNKARSTFDSLINEYGNDNHNISSFLNGAEIVIEYIRGITGNLEEMKSWTNIDKKLDIKDVSYIKSRNYIACGLAMILKENYINLEIHVENMLLTYKRYNNILGLLYTYIFDSIVKYKSDDIENAKKALLKSIDLAKEDGIVMCFVELSPHILPILKALEKESLYVKNLLPKCENFNMIYEESYLNIEKIELTPREIEVMILVEEGYKQREISEKLKIALITVKKHIASVYFKLNVKNKTIAINMLKEKGII